MSFRVAIILAVTLGSLTPSSPLSAQARRGQGVTVVVENHSFFDMHVYALQGGQRRSLGMATGFATRSFSLPQTLAESGRDIQILADPIGSRRGYLSQVLLVNPGDQVHLVLENNLALSRIFIGDQYPERESEEPPEDDEEESQPGSAASRS